MEDNHGQCLNKKNIALQAEVLKLQQEILRLKAENRDLRYLKNQFPLDITERKKPEEELRQLEKFFSRVYNNVPISIIILAIKDRRIVEVNDTFLSNNNLVRHQFLGRKNIHLNYWENPHQFEEFMQIIKQDGSIKSYEIRYHLPSGEIRTVLLSGVDIFWRGEKSVLIASNDITQLRHYEHEIAHLDRLNIIGQMSASIAHEIRNPMVTVSGFLQLFRGDERYSEDIEYMDLMIEEMDRANNIITDFLSLANNKTVKLELQNLNSEIEKLFPLLQADAIKNDISIILKLNKIPDLLLDKAEMRQLLLNLVRNGIEAMLVGGYLTIKTYKDGNGVTLAIEDQGKGISPQVMEKLGTPFYTTKEKGTGLGLPVCYKIASRYNARMDIETGQGGTIFKVIFPNPDCESIF